MELSGSDFQRLSARLLEAEAWERVREADLPHIVSCCDVVTGAVDYAGPYPSRLEAELAAGLERDLDRDCDERLRFKIAPLYPPVGC
ncbi:hypothetical protein ABIE44_001801 [Marmoricola sp. OAE513]|uniref:hypothetical protein n=1 Tax=Marmoricola sp. OAE513 TaxID=2817894 RepID=UPI001AE15588